MPTNMSWPMHPWHVWTWIDCTRVWWLNLKQGFKQTNKTFSFVKFLTGWFVSLGTSKLCIGYNHSYFYFATILIVFLFFILETSKVPLTSLRKYSSNSSKTRIQTFMAFTLRLVIKCFSCFFKLAFRSKLARIIK